MLPELHGLACGHRSGPPVRFKRTPRRQAPARARYVTGAHQDRPDAAQLVAEMQRCGAEFFIRSDAERRDFHYAFRLKDGADRERFAVLFAQAKADPELLALVRVATFVAIMQDAWNLPARRR